MIKNVLFDSGTFCLNTDSDSKNTFIDYWYLAPWYVLLPFFQLGFFNGKSCWPTWKNNHYRNGVYTYRGAWPERIYNPITAMVFLAMFTFQLDNTKS